MPAGSRLERGYARSVRGASMKKHVLTALLLRQLLLLQIR